MGVQNNIQGPPTPPLKNMPKCMTRPLSLSPKPWVLCTPKMIFSPSQTN